MDDASEQQFAECAFRDFLDSNEVEQVEHSSVSDADDDSFGLCHRLCEAKFAGQLNTYKKKISVA